MCLGGNVFDVWFRLKYLKGRNSCVIIVNITLTHQKQTDKVLMKQCFVTAVPWKFGLQMSFNEFRTKSLAWQRIEFLLLMLHVDRCQMPKLPVFCLIKWIWIEYCADVGDPKWINHLSWVVMTESLVSSASIHSMSSSNSMRIRSGRLSTASSSSDTQEWWLRFHIHDTSFWLFVYKQVQQVDWLGWWRLLALLEGSSVLQQRSQIGPQL